MRNPTFHTKIVREGQRFYATTYVRGRCEGSFDVAPSEERVRRTARLMFPKIPVLDGVFHPHAHDRDARPYES